MADMSEVYDALRAADAAGNTEDAAKLVKYIEQQSSAPTPKKATSQEISPEEREAQIKNWNSDAAAAIDQGANDLASGAVRGAGSIGATIMRALPNVLGGDTAEENVERRRKIDEWNKSQGANPESKLYATGKIGAEIAGTAGLGGVLGKGVQAVSQTPRAIALADALTSGGMRAGQAAPGFAGAAENLLIRSAGGAGAGAAQATAVEPTMRNAKIGVTLGGALPVVTTSLGGLGRLTGVLSKEPPVNAYSAAGTNNTSTAGLSQTAAEAERLKVLGDLPVPITDKDVIRSQVTRSYPEQEAERIAAGQPVIGTKTLDRLTRGQEKMLANIDELKARTGATAGTAEEGGGSIRSWMQDLYHTAKKQTSDMYDYASQVHGGKLVTPDQKIVDTLVDNRALPGYDALFNQAKNMGLIVDNAAGTGLKAGQVTVERLHDFKKAATGMGGSADGTVRHAAGDIADKVYAQLDNVGPEFREAAGLRKIQGEMFEDPRVTNKLLGTVEGRFGVPEKTSFGMTIPNYTVPSEKVVHAILNGSVEDVRYITKMAQTGNTIQQARGAQAINEMRGAMIEGLHDVWTSTLTPTAKANAVAKYFDKIGQPKLALVFGQQGLPEINNFRKATEILNRLEASPEGGSQTASRLALMGNSLFSTLAKIPTLGISSAVAGGVGMAGNVIRGVKGAKSAANIPTGIQGASSRLPDWLEGIAHAAPVVGAQ